MRIGLVSYRCENRNTVWNLRQIERALKQAKGKADLLCFGEAFLQGFDALCWNYEKDRDIALALSSAPMTQLRQWTIDYGISLIVGYIEKEGEALYSSCAVLSDGETVYNYRRISKGWKEFTKTDSHYREGTGSDDFRLLGKHMKLALCGDLWDFPEAFSTPHLLIWPVYVNYTLEEWNGGALREYAAQAALAANHVLMINPIDHGPVNHGGSFHFQNGQTVGSIPFDTEEILFVDLP